MYYIQGEMVQWKGVLSRKDKATIRTFRAKGHASYVNYRKYWWDHYWELSIWRSTCFTTHFIGDAQARTTVGQSQISWTAEPEALHLFVFAGAERRVRSTHTGPRPLESPSVFWESLFHTIQFLCHVFKIETKSFTITDFSHCEQHFASILKHS